MKRHLVVVTALVLISRTGDAELLLSDWTPEFVATRAGYSALRVDQGFAKVELLADWRLFFSRARENRWYRHWSLEGAAGALMSADRSGLVTSLGPLLKIGHNESPLFVTAGINGTLLGRNRYGDIDFGESFQFTSHLGIGVEMSRQLVFEYRLEHMSNEGLAYYNPGLNLHTIALSLRF
jgi:hypothetical protein